MEKKRLLELAGMEQLDEGLAETELLYLYAALSELVESNKGLSAAELKEIIAKYAPSVRPPAEIIKRVNAGETKPKR